MMNKLEQITNKLNSNPTLYDYYSYKREWTTEEVNQLMLLEYTEDVPILATQLNRSEFAIILKYLEVREDFESKLAFDVKVIPKDEAGEDWEVTDYPLSDFQQNVSIVHCTINDIIRVNVRLVNEELRNNPPSGLDNILSHFMIVPEEGGTSGGLFASRREQAIENVDFDPDRYGVMKYTPNQPGTCQIGYEIKETESDELGIKKTIYVVVE